MVVSGCVMVWCGDVGHCVLVSFWLLLAMVVLWRGVIVFVTNYFGCSVIKD